VSRVSRLRIKAQPWRWFDISLVRGETELNAFGGIFSGIVMTENYVVVAKFLRGSVSIPYRSITRIRGGPFADKPDDSEEIRLWGLEIHAGDEQFTVGVWNWRAACEMLELAVGNARTPDGS
jgi:hypothetical protein